MAQIIDIRRVEVGPRSLTARVRIATGAPLYTSEDLNGTARVYRLMPHIIEHTCLGDSSEIFKDVMGDTELAHLLEHVTVELLAQSDIAGDISSGRTFQVEGERRTYDVEIACPDDVLVAGALSSAVWIMQWAYSGGTDPEPDVAATVKGLVGLVQTLPKPEESGPTVVEYVVSEQEAEALIADNAIFSNETEEELEEAEAPEAPESEKLAVAVPKDAPRESPEARQASQDVAMPYEEPELLPEPVAVEQPEMVAEPEVAAYPVEEADPAEDEVESVEAWVEEDDSADREEPKEAVVAEAEPMPARSSRRSHVVTDEEIEAILAAAPPADYHPVVPEPAYEEPVVEDASDEAAEVEDFVEDPVVEGDDEVWSEVDEVVVEEDSDGDQDGAPEVAPADQMPAGLSWSSLSPAATGEWGTIPEPKFVR